MDRGQLRGRAASSATGAATRAVRLSDEARRRLIGHGWPGNLRELANLLRTLVALADDGAVIEAEDLPEDIRAEAKPNPTNLTAPMAGAGAPAQPSQASLVTPAVSASPAPASLRALTDEAVFRALAGTGGNISAAARVLGIHRATLHRRLKASG